MHPTAVLHMAGKTKMY